MKKRKKIWIIAIAIIIIAIVLFFVFKKDDSKENYSIVKAESGELTQTVSEVGTVKPVKELSLRFSSSGKIGEIYTSVGDEVESGQILASLDKESLELKKIEAQANLKIAKSNLSKTLEGSSQETIEVSLSELEQAKNAKKSAENNLEQVKKTAQESIAQAEKTLSDLESKTSNTKTVQEQAVYSAQIALDNTQETGKLSLDNSRNSALLVLNDKVLVGKVALDNLNKILDDEDAENVLGAKNQQILINTKLKINSAEDYLPEVEELVLKAQESESFQDINEAGDLLKDFLFKTSESLNSSFSLLEASVTSNSFSENDLEAYKSLVITESNKVSSALNSIENSLQAYNNAKTNYTTSVATAEENLKQAEVSLDNAITTAKNNLNNITLSSEQKIITAESNLDKAERSVNLAEARLNSVTASARSQDIDLAEAQVSQARAALNSIENQIEDRIIYAPLDGVITEVNYNVGEQYGVSGLEVIRMLANNNFEINVDISESDINKIQINDEVDVSLDAFSDDIVLPAKVTFIEPAQTLIQGVVYYKVKVLFSDPKEIEKVLKDNNLSLKSGMTANITINTERKENVVYIPSRAVIEENGKKIVRVFENDEVVKKQVKTGLQGDGGFIEITEGLNEGEEVITFIRE